LQAKQLRDDKLRGRSAGFLHQAFRYRGKANYRDALFLTYEARVGKVIEGFIHDLEIVLRAFVIMAGAFCAIRAGVSGRGIRRGMAQSHAKGNLHKHVYPVAFPRFAVAHHFSTTTRLPRMVDGWSPPLIASTTSDTGCCGQAKVAISPFPSSLLSTTTFRVTGSRS